MPDIELLSRRDFLRGAGAFSAVTLAIWSGGCEACLKQIENRPMRKNIANLSASDPIIQTYKAAVAAMKGLKSNDPRNWQNQANIHFNNCTHGNWFFLPWHRGYLLYFERICRQLTGDSKFALPYWNWTTHPAVPDVFWDTSSPLYDPNRGVTQTMQADPSWVGAPVIQNILGQTNFELSGPPIGGELHFATNTGMLEGNPHNNIHGWIDSSDMGTFMSPLDPVFWTHHNMLDCLWVDWNINLGNSNTNDPSWVNQQFHDFFDENGNAASITVFETVLYPLFLYQFEPCAPNEVQSTKTKAQLQQFLKQGAPSKWEVSKHFELTQSVRAEVGKTATGSIKIERNAMSWKRGAYRFETCLHWLVGSRPDGDFHEQWQEVCDIVKLTFVNQDEFVRLETEDRDALRLYTDVDRLEAELLRRAPENTPAIQEFTHAVRALGKFRMLDPTGGLKENWLNMLRDIPVFPLLGKLSKISGADYGKRFQDPLLRHFFTNGDIGKMTAMAMVFSLGWMNVGNAGYCIGGAQSLIRLIEEKIASLGGKIRFNARVARVLVENDTAVGVELEGGERVMADWVISAADGRTTIFEMLGGKYVAEKARKRYEERELFASYLQVSLGVAKNLSDEPAMLSRILASPLAVDPGRELDSVTFRIFHYDPTFAPPGKTAVTSTLPTRNFGYWNDLRKMDPSGYHREKQRAAEAVIGVLEKRIPGIREAIEVVDVSTPATVYRYTGNWQGTMEGWLVEPGDSFKPLRNTLPGLKRFVMAGQWVMPGGGLPSGPMTAKPAVKWICKQDHVHFDVHTEREAETVAV